jgi:hypothetical protein
MGKKPRKHGGSRESFRSVSRGFGGRTFAGRLQQRPKTFAERLQAVGRASVRPMQVAAIVLRACKGSYGKRVSLVAGVLDAVGLDGSSC